MDRTPFHSAAGACPTVERKREALKQRRIAGYQCPICEIARGYFLHTLAIGIYKKSFFFMPA